jgi:hypothetical protein
VATFTVPSGIPGEQLLRFSKNLQGIAAEQPTGRVLDGTVTISDTTSNGQPILRVEVSGRLPAGAVKNHTAAFGNPLDA